MAGMAACWLLLLLLVLASVILIRFDREWGTPSLLPLYGEQRNTTDSPVQSPIRTHYSQTKLTPAQLCSAQRVNIANISVSSGLPSLLSLS